MASPGSYMGLLTAKVHVLVLSCVPRVPRFVSRTPETHTALQSFQMLPERKLVQTLDNLASISSIHRQIHLQEFNKITRDMPKDTWLWIFVATLSMTGKNWKSSKRPTMGDQLCKLQYFHKMDWSKNSNMTNTLHKVDIIINSTLQMEKLKHREVNYLAQSHRASKW